VIVDFAGFHNTDVYRSNLNNIIVIIIENGRRCCTILITILIWLNDISCRFFCRWLGDVGWISFGSAGNFFGIRLNFEFFLGESGKKTKLN
jgi:hypothetical protein